MSVRMPPIELANAKGIINLAGLVPADFAMARMMGNSSATVPVLLTKAATTAVTSKLEQTTTDDFGKTGLEHGTADHEETNHHDHGRVGETGERL